MHLWHKWKTVQKGMGTAVFNGLATRWKDVREPILAELQRCEKCGAERGRIQTLNGDTRIVDAEFFRGSKTGVP